MLIVVKFVQSKKGDPFIFSTVEGNDIEFRPVQARNAAVSKVVKPTLTLTTDKFVQLANALSPTVLKLLGNVIDENLHLLKLQ